MKRNIITLLITVFAMLQATAQTYDNLWKQADIIAQKDQPKSEIGVMKKIISKATAAKDYGQLLAAEIRQAILWREISLDSLTPNVKRMETEALKAKDPVLKAVRYAVLGKVYREVNGKKSEEFFKKALEQPELLARNASTGYVPLTLKGVDGSSFKNDLLHLIGFEADGEHLESLYFRSLILQRHLLDFSPGVEWNEEEDACLYTVLAARDAGIVHAVAALIAVEWRLAWFPAWIPDGIAILDVEVATTIIHRYPVVAIAGETTELGILIERIPTCCVGDKREEILVTQIVDPRPWGLWVSNHVLAIGVIKMTILFLCHCFFNVYF